MARLHGRTIVAAAIMVLGCTAVAVALGRYMVDRTGHEPDHTVTGTVPVGLVDDGPPAGPLTTVWSRRYPVRDSGLPQFDQVSYGLVDDQVVATSARGFDVSDPRSGKERWHFHRHGWVLLGWSATGRELIGYFERYRHRSAHLTIGFDAVSGTELWHSEADSAPVIDRTQPRWPGFDGTVLMARGKHRVVGVESRNGNTLWTRALPDGCKLPGTGDHAIAGDRDIAVLALDCAGFGEVIALDPETGHVSWSRRTGTGPDRTVAASGGVVELTNGSNAWFLDVWGRNLLHVSGDDVCAGSCPFAVSGTTLVVAYRKHTTQLAGVDISKRRVTWSHSTGQVDRLTASGGMVYAVGPTLAKGLAPAAVSSIEPSSGTVTEAPLPFGYPAGERAAWLAAAGGLLYVAYPVENMGKRGGLRLVALRGGPGGAGPDVLGGVRKRMWPDACDLLSGADLTAVFPGTAYHPRGRHTGIQGVQPSAATSCDYHPRSDAGTGVTASVLWVAADDRRAHALLASLVAQYPRAKSLRDVADEAYDLGSLSGEVDMRVGRLIIGISVGRENGGTSTQLAKAAAARLRAATGTPTPSASPSTTPRPG